MRLLVALAILLLLGFAHGHKNSFICRNCGKDLASSASFLEGNSPDSIGYGRDDLIPEEYEVFYEEFQPTASGEATKLYYMEEIEEQSVSILPEKKKSDRFPGFTYQTIICRICKQPIGYLYSPVDRNVANMIETPSIFQTSIGNYLDYCPYTKCWDIHHQIITTLNELETLGYTTQQAMISLSKELMITRQVIHSQTLFDIDMMGIWSDNATAVFGYNYQDTPPSPFYSFYLPRSNVSMHVDVMKMMEEGTIPMLEINVGEGEGMTEVRFVFCDAGQDRMKIQSLSCPVEKELACTITLCVSEFGIPPSRASGSFFALFAEEVVLDTPELDETLDSVDMMHIPHFG